MIVNDLKKNKLEFEPSNTVFHFRFAEEGDWYGELYGRVMHKINNLRVVAESGRIRNNRKMVWKKQRAREQLSLLMAILKDMPNPFGEGDEEEYGE